MPKDAEECCKGVVESGQQKNMILETLFDKPLPRILTHETSSVIVFPKGL